LDIIRAKGYHGDTARILKQTAKTLEVVCESDDPGRLQEVMLLTSEAEKIRLRLVKEYGLERVMDNIVAQGGDADMLYDQLVCLYHR